MKKRLQKIKARRSKEECLNTGYTERRGRKGRSREAAMTEGTGC